MNLRQKLFTVIFEADTRAGRYFDQALLVGILLSLLVVMVDSVKSLSTPYAPYLSFLEWAFTLAFTIEYVLRIFCAQNRWRYVISFFGLIDLLSILPTYLALFFPELNALLAVRVFRMLRVFRVFKLTAYLTELSLLASAMRQSRRKIMVFLSIVLSAVLVMGTLMYVVEGPENGFTSIPVSIYWAITTMTTVGFGDIAPRTDLGRFISSVMMLMGWGTLAVPTGIVTTEMAVVRGLQSPTTRTCPECLTEGLGAEDRYCRQCGIPLRPYQTESTPSEP